MIIVQDIKNDPEFPPSKNCRIITDINGAIFRRTGGKIGEKKVSINGKIVKRKVFSGGEVTGWLTHKHGRNHRA